MHTHGNPNQWNGAYPDKDTLLDDINKGYLYVITHENGRIYGVFALIGGKDPTYEYIEGKWKSDTEYGTIHRIASDGMVSDVVKTAVDYCEKIIPSIRIDTHEKNKTMRHVLKKLGFVECGIIYIDDGTPRIAYQKVKKGV